MRGVTRDRCGKSWYARIQVDGVQHNLGYFGTEAEAEAAYLAAQDRLRGGRPYTRNYTRNQGYDLSELRYRPLEHVLEALNCLQLAEAWGMDKTTAAQVAADPSRFVGTSYELTDERAQQLRRWLEAQGC